MAAVGTCCWAAQAASSNIHCYQLFAATELATCQLEMPILKVFEEQQLMRP